MGEFWGKFLRYRFDFAALAYDCVAAFFRNEGPFGRVMALMGAILMVVPPIAVLVFGHDEFGDGWAFGLTLVLFVIVLEAPGHRWRMTVADDGVEVDNGAYDHFLFLILSVASSLVAPIILIYVHIESSVLLGVVWGIALIAAQDLARSTVACFLALTHGRPVYLT